MFYVAIFTNVNMSVVKIELKKSNFGFCSKMGNTVIQILGSPKCEQGPRSIPTT